MRRSISVLCAGLAVLVASAALPAGASTVIFRTDAELAALSTRVVHGRAIRQRVERPDGQTGTIYTVTTLAVLEDFTGVSGREVEVWELGGTWGDETQWIGGAVTYSQGDEVLVFLERGRFGLRSVAMGFGKFDVEPIATGDGSLDGRLTRNTYGMSVIGRPAARAPERTLAEFRELTAAVKGVRPVRNRDASLFAPESEGSAGFTFLGPARWTEADSGAPVNWYLNTTGPSPLTSSDGVAEMQTALQGWTAPTTASIVLQYAGTTNQSSAKGSPAWTGIPSSGVGVVTFEDPNNEISGSTLAIGGGAWYTGGAGGTINGTAFGKFIRGYVLFANSADLSASFHLSTNFTRVLEHEIGHAIGLGHSAEGSANIMHPSCCASNTPVAPAIGPDDLAAINFIYPSGSTPPPPPTTCTYSIFPSSNSSIAAAGGSGTVTVTATAGCAWTAIVSSTATFISISAGPSGTGNGIVSYSVAANTTTVQRSGTITIAGQTFTVTQAAAACGYTLSAAGASSAAAAGSATLTVTTTGTNCAWTAVSNDTAFLSVTSGAAVTGSGTVGYALTANAAVAFRVGTLTVAGQTFTVTQAGSGPAMTLDKATLNYGGVNATAGFSSQTLSQTVRLSQSGAGTVTWTAVPSVSWLTVSPASGTGSATLTISVAHNATVPGAGTVAGSIALSFGGAGAPSGPVTVNLKIFSAGTPAAPGGALDTPVDGVLGVTGSLAVTGWAIDDVEVSRVRILRDAVAGEPAGLVPLGTASFVDGARGDIAALFPTLPRNTRGGWGYLLLTNFLPSLGNGTFRIHAYADDVDGHTTLLGSRTITCTNSTAVTPFGAIDTPAQGETISGSVYNNFGWVLTRGPAVAYPPGGTVTVIIDGVASGAPLGWVSRPDLTALFPAATFPGITNALGVATLNTTLLANGLHTIAWVVTASDGQATGVGSRYFTVANASGSVVEAGVAGMDDVNGAPQDRAAILSRRGYDLSTPLRAHAVGASGRVTVYGEELDRFELELGAPDPGTTLTGYLRTGETLAALPAGSNLDPSTGVFTWQPGVGFVHGYDFTFVRSRDGRAVSRQEVRVVIVPRGSNRVGAQVVIDAPTADFVGPRLFFLGGWAIDMDVDAGTGIDVVHVWAYPVGGGAPLFAGAAAYGGRRPDIAAVYGERFAESGYGLLVSGLPPGTYDLAVFARSTVTGAFVRARVVRVTVR